MTIKSHLAALGLPVTLCILVVAGCASPDSGAEMQAGIRKMTPSFMLSDHDRAERKLKDPESLNLKYGQWQEQLGQPTEARKSYELVLRDDPRSVEAILGVARMDQLADKPKDAEAGFQKALRLKPNDPVVLASLGQFYTSQKRWPEAFESLNAAIAGAPKVPAYRHELAVAKTRSGDVNAGLALFSELVGRDMAHYNVAYLLRQDGKTEAAVQQCQLALEANPKFEPAKTLLGQIAARQVANDSRGLNRGAISPVSGSTSPRPIGVFSKPPDTLTQSSIQWTYRGANGPYTLKKDDATFAPAPQQSTAPPDLQSPAAPSGSPLSAASVPDDPWASTPKDPSPTAP